MDAIEAIHGRRSVRAFKPDPIPREVLEKIMRAALAAPSWENTQPWEFTVLGPKAMKEFRAAVAERTRAGIKPNLDIPWPKFSGVHRERGRRLGKEIRGSLGLSKDDPQGLRDWWLSMTQFFNAPNGVIVYMDASLGEWSILDTGMAVENLMIAAWHCGVGTCVMSAVVNYPDIIRSLFNIPDSKRIIVGIAVGYPDFSSPKATFRASHEALETMVKWQGFE
ncbi:MAG: hypothetical protein FJZ95_09070 [Chloroflexi bacterium]|nr:hypothetical protein [Chloroflexota bacterium]